MKSLVDTSVNHLLVGQVLQERYQILEVLNHGAFSQTYLAQDLILSNHPLCVIKFYHEYRNSSYLYATSLRLFLKEARNLQILEGNAQIPQLLDCFEQENHGLYLVQEYVDGQLYTEILPSNAGAIAVWSEQKVWNFIHELLKILEFVHRRGLIHGDLKPSNMIRRNLDQRLVLIDFGSAHSVYLQDEDNATETTQSLLRATISVSPSGYVAPEQLIGEYYANSDLYALGIMAIQALTGVEPTELQLNLETGELIWESLWEHQKNANSRHLTKVINQMVRYRYQDRYQSATEALKDLETIHIPEEPPIIIFSQCEWPGIAIAKNKSESSVFHNILPSELESEPEVILEQNVTTDSSNITAVASENQSQNESQNEDIDSDHDDYDDNIDDTDNTDEFTQYLEKFAFDGDQESRQSKYLPLVAGVGIALIFVNAFALSWGLQNLISAFASDSGVKLLVKANEAYQQGNVEEAIALAKAVKEDSAAYAESKTILQAWEKQWNLASQHLETIEQAYQGQDWQIVVNTAKELPQIAYWQSRALPLVQKAQLEIETQAHQLLQQAFNAASQRDFTTALRCLEKISPESKLGTRVQTKLVEYRYKEQVRTQYYLQQAFNRAEERDFEGAIAFLSKIPADASVSQLAQTKIAEYKHLQWIKEEVARRAALRSVVYNQESILVNRFVPPQWSIATANLNPGMELQEIATNSGVR